MSITADDGKQMLAKLEAHIHEALSAPNDAAEQQALDCAIAWIEIIRFRGYRILDPWPTPQPLQSNANVGDPVPDPVP